MSKGSECEAIFSDDDMMQWRGWLGWYMPIMALKEVDMEGTMYLPCNVIVTMVRF
jgi:hypothetical protein